MSGFPSRVDRRILAVAVPAFFALVSEPLMLLVDTAIVGRLGTPELAGLGAASTVLLTFVGLCVFLAYGSTATVGRLHGAGRADDAYRGAIGGLWLALGLGVVLGGVTTATSGPVARALTDSAESAGHAADYLAISGAAVPAMLLSLAATGALRGTLDLRTPLVVTVLANVVNAALNLWFVHGIGLGVPGSALGTTVAQWAGAVALTAVVLVRARRAGAASRPDVGSVLGAAGAGVPLLVRTATLRASLLVGTAVAASMGDVPLAAHQIATSLVSFLAFALDAVAIAGQTLTGRALGASDPVLARGLTRRMIAWGVWTGVLGGAVLAVASPWLGGWFVDDPDVHRVLVPALLVVAAVQPVSGVVFVLDGVLIGAGDGAYLAWAGLVTFAVYAPLAVLVGVLGAGFAWLWVAYGGFQLARLVTLWVRQRGDRWMVLGA